MWVSYATFGERKFFGTKIFGDKIAFFLLLEAKLKKLNVISTRTILCLNTAKGFKSKYQKTKISIKKN